MPFDAKSLMVQIPCGSLTVIERERLEAEQLAKQFWEHALAGCARDTGRVDCWRGSDRVDIERLTDNLCAGTEPLVVRTFVQVSALPTLREQLNARLKEIDAAQEAVDRKTSQG